MQVYTIPQKESCSGSIHDIASAHYDREIRFRKGTRFAVVNASYYGGKGYTTHKTVLAAIAESERRSESHEIIDIEGNRLCVVGHKLYKTGSN